MLYLEDLPAGRRFASGSATVGEHEIEAFARAFDPQSFHLDEEAARSSFFGGLAASGWHTAAVTMKLLVDAIPLAGGIVGLGGEIAWPAPVRPGDVLHVDAEVVEATPSRSRSDRGTVVLRSETKTATGLLVQTSLMRLLVLRRPDPGEI